MVFNSYHLDTIPVVTTPCDVPSCDSHATYRFSTGSAGRPYCWTHLPFTGKLISDQPVLRPIWSRRTETTTRVIYAGQTEHNPVWFERFVSADSAYDFIDVNYEYSPCELDITIHSHGETTTIASTTVPITSHRGRLPFLSGQAFSDWLRDQTPEERFQTQIEPQPRVVQTVE